MKNYLMIFFVNFFYSVKKSFLEKISEKINATNERLRCEIIADGNNLYCKILFREKKCLENFLFFQVVKFEARFETERENFKITDEEKAEIIQRCENFLRIISLDEFQYVKELIEEIFDYFKNVLFVCPSENVLIQNSEQLKTNLSAIFLVVLSCFSSDSDCYKKCGSCFCFFNKSINSACPTCVENLD